MITSPNFPNDYEDKKDCQITIKFASDKAVEIAILSFDIESHSSCYYDYLAVYEGEYSAGNGTNSSDSSIIGSRLCGTGHIGRTIRSKGNIMTLYFHSDGSVVRAGFRIIARAGKSHNLISSYLMSNEFLKFHKLQLKTNFFKYKMNNTVAPVIITSTTITSRRTTTLTTTKTNAATSTNRYPSWMTTTAKISNTTTATTNSSSGINCLTDNNNQLYVILVPFLCIQIRLLL